MKQTSGSLRGSASKSCQRGGDGLYFARASAGGGLSLQVNTITGESTFTEPMEPRAPPTPERGVPVPATPAPLPLPEDWTVVTSGALPQT